MIRSPWLKNWPPPLEWTEMIKKILAFGLVALLACPPVYASEEADPIPTAKEVYQIVPIDAGSPAPFSGILLSYEAAAKMATDKKFEDASCELRIGYELHLQEERYKLQLDFKDIEITSWKDRYESMMILKSAENDRLEKLILKQNPSKEPWLIAIGYGLGTLTSLGIFALSTEIVK